MTAPAMGTKPKRPEFRNINAFKDLTTYRMAPAAWVSILHRASGAIMFLLMPFIIWMFDTSVSSEISFRQIHQCFQYWFGFCARLVLQIGRFGVDLGLFAAFHCGFASFVHGLEP